MKLFSFFSIVTVTTLAAASGFAHNPNSPDDQATQLGGDHEARIRHLEKMHGTTASSSAPSDLVINSPHGCMEHGFSLEGEFLWWRAHLDDLEYAFKANTSFIGLPTPVNLRTKVKEPNFKYDPGVRLSAGYDFGRRNWDIFLRWTYHYTDPTDRTGSDDPAASVSVTRLAAAPTGLFGVVIADTGFAKWTNRFNAFDFEMGYDYFFSNRFSFRPHMGLKAAWIDMEYKNRFTQVRGFSAQGTQPEVVLHTDGGFWGVGPRVGMDGHLHIGWGFSLYTMASAAMLYGQFNSDLEVLSPAEGSRIVIDHDDFFRLRAAAQIALGLRWGWCFSRKYFLSLHIGWENQYWWNQLEMRFGERYEPDADLTFSGLDVGIRFDF